MFLYGEVGEGQLKRWGRFFVFCLILHIMVFDNEILF